jgi:hypothetical protein
MTIDEARQAIGRRVVYKPWPEAPQERWDRGTITGTNDATGGIRALVFVRYGGDQLSKATRPCDLELDS